MTQVLQCQLSTDSFNTSGWTAIRGSGKPISYIRELSPSKVEPPNDSRTLILLESGAQCTMVMPFSIDSLKYLESHCVEMPLGQEITKESQVMGCKCLISKVELRTNQLSNDGRGMLLIFMEGESTYQISLDKNGGLLVSKI